MLSISDKRQMIKSVSCYSVYNWLRKWEKEEMSMDENFSLKVSASLKQSS